MTANDESPGNGHESTESEDQGPPLMDASNEELARAIEEGKNQVLFATEDVTTALNTESEPLKDDDVGRLWDAASRLERLCETLVHRVPDEHRVEDSRE
jgi:hypothetical protein